MTRIAARLRQAVRDRAHGCCEYCKLSEADAFLPHEVDHTIAVKHGGETGLDNLCLSCFDCNRRKGSDLTSIDPEGGAIVPLFNPRQQRWEDHFRLNEALIYPLTAQGRVTIQLLRMNEPEQLEKRTVLIGLGRYPCTVA